MNRTQATQMLVFVACAMFVISYFTPFDTFLNGQTQDKLVAYPMHISPFAGSGTPQGFSPSQIRTAYNLPSSGGAGTTIAIIDAYDTPNIQSDYTIFSNQYGLKGNDNGNFMVHKMATNIGTDSGWAEETCLDVEWAHAVAPDAKILLVEAVNSYSNNLLQAIDYAVNYPGVVAVSMSWGMNESRNQVNWDHHFNKAGIAFFAASGDDGSSVGTYWPASSPYVVAVGGTTLNFNPIISETAWNGSGGGISNYELRPSYQTSYGLKTPNRTVPDVSYNANPNTGVAVSFNGQWYKIGGTSAGAPQWAAIHALGLSATNNNLYQRAKTAYSANFRDITAGSNGNYTATAYYDYVTGLGSPLTFNFGTSLEVSPTSGPAGGLIALNGLSFLGSSANISYLNPLNSSWIPLANNISTGTGNFSFNFNSPDLLQSNPTGDNQALFDKIVFRAQDNSNGRSYNTATPYTEMRRGLTQAGNITAQGLFGNNTNLATSVFVQNGDTVPFSGAWFSPGTVSLIWDNSANLGTASIDDTGFFNTTIIVPFTSAGQHTVTISDGATNFCVNLTRLPTVANDYVDGWHTSDFIINLSSDYPVNETFYRLNGGPIQNVSANGQPKVTTEGSGNTLEYWSRWNVYGTGITDLPHLTLTGIKLYKTAPAGTITTGATTTQTLTITLFVSATDSTAGIAQMRFSNDNASWSDWEPYATTKTWTLQSGDGQKTVTAQFMDNAGLTSTASYTLTLETPQATTAPMAAPTQMTNPTLRPSVAQTESPTPTSTATPDPVDLTQTATPSVPEVPSWILLVFVFSTLILAIIIRKKRLA